MKNLLTILLISIFCLSSCSGDRCIDADDFGFIKFVISSRYPKDQLSIKQKDNETAPWVDSQYKVNGQPLTIVVKAWDYKKGDRNNEGELSAWGPWYGTEDNFHTLSDFCVRLQECRFRDGIMCTTKKDATIVNAPCLFKNGVGLYFLIAARDSDPNISDTTQRNPDGITAHLGEPHSNYSLYDLTKRGEVVPAGGINYQYDNDQQKSYNYSQCPLYFKILDKFYEDNNGQYKLVIKSGVSDTRPDPLEFLTTLIIEELFGKKNKYPKLYDKDKNQPELSMPDPKDEMSKGIVQSVYENIIKTPGYRITVSALLTLYVMFTGCSFLIGNVNFTHTELIMRLFKVSIISILLSSSDSWQFFHDYLFVYFVEGVQEVLRIIKETSSIGPGSSSLIALMIAPQTMAKLFSLLFVDPLGFIYIFFYLIALYFIFMLIFKATIIYLTALITIGMIITMAPIFICFMLFGITRSLFENWLKQLISYAIQPIILFTGLAFISMIIRTEIYSTLGFAVCKHDFPKLERLEALFTGKVGLDDSIEGSLFYWWFPTPLKREGGDLIKANIPVPVDHTIPDGTVGGKLCQAYECIEERYVEFPFLDPDKDMARIESFRNGKFVHLDAILLIFACIYLLSKFNDIAVAVARFLSSTTGNLTRLETAGALAYNPIYAQINRPMNYVVGSTKKRMSRTIDSFSQPFAQWYEKTMKERLAQEALNPNSVNSSVLNEVKRKYGIDYSDVNINAGEDYRKAIESILSKGKIEIASKDIEKLTGQSYSDLLNSIANLKYEKAYGALDENQKKEMNALISLDRNKTLRELASDAEYTKFFQQAYIDSHQQMSGRGIGFLGKNFFFLRKLQEMQHRVKSQEELREEKRRNRGERFYAAYTGLKRDLLTAIVGKKTRDAIEGNLTSAEWHDFDYNDARLRTHNEIVRDKERERKAKELNNIIDQKTLKVNNDILSPWYLARLEQEQEQARKRQDQEQTRERQDQEQARKRQEQEQAREKQEQRKIIEYYQNLAYQQLSVDIYNRLSATQEEGHEIEPALMGERFMREKATDQQTRNMIDQIYRQEKLLIQEDRYIRSEERYKRIRDETEAKADATSIEQFHYSEKVLDKIAKRKEFIKKETQSYIREINRYRVKANMSEYVRADNNK